MVFSYHEDLDGGLEGAVSNAVDMQTNGIVISSKINGAQAV